MSRFHNNGLRPPDLEGLLEENDATHRTRPSTERLMTASLAMETRPAWKTWLAVTATTLLVTTVAACSSDAPLATPSPGPSSPTADLEVRVLQQDFQATYALNGATARSEAVGFDVPDGMTLNVGSMPRDVVVGSIIGQRVTLPAEVGVPDAVTQRIQTRAESWVGDVRAQVSGRLTQGPQGAVIEQRGYDVVIPVSPLQELRYRGMRYHGTAAVETVYGPTSVPCVALWLERETAPAPPVQGEEVTVDPAALATGRLHCRLPSYIETATGLRAKLTTTSEVIENALLVPASAISHDPETQSAFVRVKTDESHRRVDVVTGATDGVVQVVVGDLRAGDELVPATDSGSLRETPAPK